LFESRFQSFVELGDPSHGSARVSALRAELAKRGIAGFIVPRADEHQNEYVPPSAERLRWLTGFAGSAGIAVVLEHVAALFVDGRYTAQVKTQADGSVFEFRHVVDEPATEWIAQKHKRGDKLG
jgi:Xaa-Pro aminopeptidase